MAPASRTATIHPSSSRTTSSGILSGVFGFVSREFESFVANATGSSLPEGSDTFTDSGDDEEDAEQFQGDLEVASSEDDVHPRMHRRSKQSNPTISPRRPHREIQRATPPSTERKRPRKSHSKKDGVEKSASDTSLPSPPTLPGVLKRRQSFNMPGSLFPRSPSMDPESTNQVDLGCRVRFLADCETSPPPTWDQDAEEDNMPGPSSRSRTPNSQSPETVRTGKPRRKSSVKAVVDKFRLGEKDADPSILLPSPNNSPGRARSISSRHFDIEHAGGDVRRWKGKERAVSPEKEWEESSRDTLMRGKEKELDLAREEQRKHEWHWERDQDDLHVKLAEKERERDKEKIRMLEEEIQRLKTELSRRSAAESSTPDFIPPPPPAPPPPPPLPNKTILRLPTSSGDPDALFASARAALKHAPTPSEAPINPPSRRQGQPSIGIAPDKMAAFLTEMKTVRLRKVSGRSASGESVAGPSSATRMPRKDSFTTPSLRPTNLARASTVLNKYSNSLSASLPAGMDAHIGEKRKRCLDSSVLRDDPRPTAKRRSLPSSSDSSFASTSTSSSFLPSGSTSLSTSQPPSSRPVAASRNWRPPSTVDAPTPSLCSDNDNEREGDVSPEDPPPSTPPLPPSRGIYRFKGTGIPVEDEPERDIIDVDMLEYSPPANPTSLLEDGPALLAQRLSTNIFDRRPPSSPMPDKSPRKPRPPARASRPIPPPRPSEDSEDEDPLSMSFTSPEEGSQPSDKASRSFQKRNPRPPQEEARRNSKQRSVRLSSAESSRSKVSKAELKARRRQTLDEELRNASSEQEMDEMSLDDGVLMGYGTMSKQRGFLAHGGAGGAPVFMGVGYVQGVEDPADVEVAMDDEDDYPLTRFKTDSRRTGLRRS